MTWYSQLLGRFDAWVDNLDVYAPHSRAHRRPAMTELTAGGIRYSPADPARLAAHLSRLDKPGEHLWVMTAAWAVTDPQSLAGPTLLDAENLVGFAGPGCYKCEKEWSREVAAQRCTGSTTL